MPVALDHALRYWLAVFRELPRARARVLLDCLLFAWSLSVGLDAQAQDSKSQDSKSQDTKPVEHTASAPDTGKNYRETIQEALREYQLGNWNEAFALFQRAHTMNPSARTLNGMGMTAFENRQYVMSADYLRRAMDDSRHPISAKQRAEAVDLIQRAEGFIVRFTIELEPHDAALLVDSAPAVRGADGTVLLDPGEHELVASAADHDNVVRRVRAVSGQPERMSIVLPHTEIAAPTVATLPPPPAAPPAALTPNTRDEPKHDAVRSTLIVAGLIGAGAGVVVGTGAGAWAWSNDATLKDKCPRDVCQPASRGMLNTAKTMATISTISFGVAAAGLVLAAVGWLMLPPEREPTTQNGSSAAAITTTSQRARTTPFLVTATGAGFAFDL